MAEEVMTLKKVLYILMVLAAVGSLAACGTSAAADKDNTKCNEVAGELEQAREKAEDKAGTPDESDANKRVEALEERATECDSEESASVPTPEEDARECPATWKIVHVDHEDSNRWFADGVREIRDASTPEEAREAARTWLSLVRRDPNLLKGAASYFTDGKVNASDLVDGECASEEAESLTAEIELAIAEAKVTPDEAPADGTNSGTDAEGNVTSASQAGITGDRTAIKIMLKDGSTIWIMARCGNPVVKGPAPVPPGPTDNPPPTTTKVPPTTTTTKPPTSYDCQQNGTGPNCPFPPVQQPPQDNRTAEENGVNTGSTPNAPKKEPPPTSRPPGDPNGGSGDGGAPPPTGPTDDSDSDQETEAPPPGEDQCPLGPGNC